MGPWREILVGGDGAEERGDDARENRRPRPEFSVECIFSTENSRGLALGDERGAAGGCCLGGGDGEMVRMGISCSKVTRQLSRGGTASESAFVGDVSIGCCCGGGGGEVGGFELCLVVAGLEEDKEDCLKVPFRSRAQIADLISQVEAFYWQH